MSGKCSRGQKEERCCRFDCFSKRGIREYRREWRGAKTIVVVVRQTTRGACSGICRQSSEGSEAGNADFGTFDSSYQIMGKSGAIWRLGWRKVKLAEFAMHGWLNAEFPIHGWLNAE